MEIAIFYLPNLDQYIKFVIPLYIVEERYKLMINGCIDRDEAFGLVLLRFGSDDETEETIHRVGVTARVAEVERLEDGRMNMLCGGESRFRIYRFTLQKPFWKASVDLFEDDERHSTESLYEQVAELYRSVAELSAKVSGNEQAELALPESATDLSYMVSYVLDIESEEKQKLLEMNSTAERLRMLIAHLTETIRKLEQQRTYKEVVAKVRANGDLGKPHSGD